MDIQTILVLALFVLAVLYVGRMIYRNVKPGEKAGACKTCNACSDFSDIKPQTANTPPQPKK